MDTALMAPCATTVKLESGDMSRDATSPEPAAVQVFVTGNGKTQPVQVGATNEEHVAEAIARQTGGGTQMDSILMYAGRPVKADATVQDLGLQQGSTLTTQPFSALCGGAGYYLPMHSQAGAVENCKNCCSENCCCCCSS